MSETKPEPATPSTNAGSLADLAKHTSVYAIGTMLSRIASFLLLPLYTAYLTPFDYGVLEIVETTSGMIGLVAAFGMAQAMGRFYFDAVDQDGRDLVVATTFSLATIAVALMLIVSIPFAGMMVRLLFGSDVSPLTLIVGLLTIGVGLLVDLGSVYLRTINRSTTYVAVSMANMVIGIGLNVWFIVGLKLGVMGILWSSLITKIVTGMPVVVWIWRRVGFRFDRVLARAMYRYSAPLMPSELASVAIGYSDRYFINGFMSTADAGIYGMAQKLGTSLHYLVTNPFLTAFITQRFAIGKTSHAQQTLAAAYKYHMVLLVVLSGVLALFAPEIIVFMTAPQFGAAESLVPAVALTMIVLAMKYHFEYGILREKKTHYVMYINITSALMHVALNFALIEFFGLWGAIFASLIAYSIKSVGYLLVSQRLFPVPYPWLQVVMLMTVCGVIATAADLLLPVSLWGSLLKFPIALVLATMPFVLRSLSVNDLRVAVAYVRGRLGKAGP